MRDGRGAAGQPRSRPLQVPDLVEGNLHLRTIAAGALALALFAAPAPGSEPELRPWQGGATPALALADATGRRVDLEQMRGHVVLVNFWATWCEPCRAEMASLELLRKAVAGKPFEVLAVNYGESREKVAAFVKGAALDLPVLFDPGMEAAKAWGVKGLPMSFLVDAEGRVRYWLFGERAWNDAEAKRVVGQLLGEPAPKGQLR